jgi:hypothetical protein
MKLVLLLMMFLRYYRTLVLSSTYFYVIGYEIMFLLGMKPCWEVGPFVFEAVVT